MVDVRATSETTLTGTATSHDIVLPAGIEADDLIALYLSTQEGTAAGPPTISSLAGDTYTQILSEGGDAGFQPEVTIFHRVADGSEDGDTITFDWGATAVETHIGCIVWMDVDPTDPLSGTPPAGVATVDPPAITTDDDGAEVVVIAAGNAVSTPSPTAPTDYTIRFDQTPDARALVIASRTVATAGVEDPGSFTWSPLDNDTAVTYALKPATGVNVTPERAGLAVAANSPTGTTDIIPATAGLRLGARTPTVPRPEPPAFPDANLDLTVELAFGAGNTAPTGWTWTDVTEELAERIHRQAITPKRGRSDEAGVSTPSSVSITFDNSDGHLSPQNASSIYWPNVRRGTPLRIAVDAGEPALLISGNGSASTADHPDFDVTDLDVRMRLHPTAWGHATDWTLNNGDRSLSDTRYRLFSKWNSAGVDERSWALSLYAAGWPVAEWSTDGTSAGSTLLYSEALVAALRPIWVAMTIDVDAGQVDGDDTHLLTIYRNDAATPPADVTTWDVVDQVRYSPGTTSIFQGTEPIRLGALSGIGSFLGRIHKFEMRDGINGTVIADPDFTAATPGDVSVTDSTGKVWTLSGDAEISRRRYRYVGKVDDWTGPMWPYGDNEPSPASARPSESRVTAVASGILRRLGSGARSKPLRSSLFRHIRAVQYRPSVISYWPCEDDTAAVQLASGVADGNAATITGAELANNSTLPASAALPTVQQDDVSTWSAAVGPGSTPSDRWAVEWFWRMDTAETNPTFSQLISVKANGDVGEFVVLINDTNIILRTLDSGGVQLSQFVFGSDPGYFGSWNLSRLEVQQDGADIDWEVSTFLVDTGTSFNIAGTESTVTLGSVTTVGNTITGPPNGYSWGHVTVVDAGALGPAWKAGADTAWVGETAAHRIWRLCNEEGVPCEIVGDPSVYELLRGDLAFSEPMGPQGRKSLVQLLRDCVLLDMGILIERRGLPGLVYRCRHTLEAQDPVLELDAARNTRGDIVNPLEPKLDDQKLVNDVTVTATGGSSAQHIDQDHIDDEDLYDTDLTVNGVGGVAIQSSILATQAGLQAAVDNQNLDQAAWRVHLGTWPELRWPSVTISLEIAATLYPDIIDQWLDVELGDRITLTNLPVQYPDETVELLLEHIAEGMTPTRWRPQLTCRPGGPWLLGVLDA